MAEPLKSKPRLIAANVVAIAAPDPETAAPEFQDIGGSVRAVVLEADTSAGQWSSEMAVALLVEGVRALEMPAILLAIGTGKMQDSLSEAFDLCFFDEQVTLQTPEGILQANEAERRGLVNLAVPAKEAVRAAYDAAETVASLAPLAVKAAKRAVRNGSSEDLVKGMELENQLFRELFGTGDMREGTSAFLEKREPDFRGE